MSETANNSRSSARPWHRGFVVIAALAFVGVGLLLAARPFFAQMEPNPGTPAPVTVDVDLEDIEPGQSATVAWRGLPVIVMRRTNAEMSASRSVAMEALVDRFARNEALSTDALATDANRALPQWLVVIGINPQSGCRLRVLDAQSRFNDETFVCPCDGSRFDALGRVRAGPARTNLRVPVYRLLNPNRMRLG